jgi:hypothetical protein
MDTLPAPNDPRVHLQAIPAPRFVPIRFSGTATQKVLQQRTEELRPLCYHPQTRHSRRALDDLYNPPWNTALFRRNEIMLELPTPRPRSSNVAPVG